MRCILGHHIQISQGYWCLIEVHKVFGDVEQSSSGTMETLFSGNT